MWTTFLETTGAEIARLTPHAAPGAWLPVVGYAITAIGASVIALATLAMTRSRVAAVAIAIAFVMTPPTEDAGLGLLLIALMAFGVSIGWLSRLPPSWLLPLLIVGLVDHSRGAWLNWTVAGAGLGGVAAVVRSQRWPRLTGTAVITALTLILITARLPAATTSEPPAPKPMGHDGATAASFRQLIANIPTGSDLVRDDAITSMLFRANQRDLHRARVDIEAIDNDPAVIRQQLTARRVFALPHAQATLQLQGFQIVDSLRTANRGLAEVVAGGDCVTATHEWQFATSLTGRTSLSFVADRESRHGPIEIYLVGNEPIRISAVNWPARTLRGFSPRTFDLSNAQDRQDLERQRTEDEGPRTEDLGASAMTRVALWRMPDAALAMQIDLSAPATRAAVRLAPEADRPVSVCPAFPAAVSPIR